MRITTADLRRALKTTSAAISTRPPFPALAGVVIASADSGATFSATDFETWVSTEVSNDGDCMATPVLVSHFTLSAIAKVMQGGAVTLEMIGAELRLSAGSSAWTVPVMPYEDYPEPPKTPVSAVELDAALLRRMVRSTVDAAGGNLALPKLLPIHFEAVNGQLLVSATDGYQLRQARADLAREVGPAVAYPHSRAVGRLIDALNGPVSLCFDDNKAGIFAMQDGATRILLRTIDNADIPDVGSYLPTVKSMVRATTTVSAGDLAAAIRAATPMVQGNGGVLLTVTEDEITVARTGDSGGASAAVDGHKHDGDGIMVDVNPAFLLGAIEAMGSDDVVISWTGPTKPVLIGSPQNPDIDAIVMVIRNTAARWIPAPS